MASSIRNRIVVFILVPLGLLSTAYFVSTIPYLKYTRGIYEFLVFLCIADLAIALRGKWRDTATVVAVLTFGLAAFEFVCAAFESRSVETRGFSISRPVLGWGPSAPGLYHGEKIGTDGSLIYSVDYTIDDLLVRHTQSGSAGPTAVFFGDSMTFGQGLSDTDTLPQVYADLTERKTRTLNLGFPGYGPQQMLRALETGLFDELISDAKIFVFQTANWHIERSSCMPGFMARAPRYELRDGEPVFVGACAEGLHRVLQDIVGGGAIFHSFVAPITDAVGAKDVELFIAELRRSAELVKQKFGARLIVLYLSDGDEYLAKSGFTDVMIEERLRESGVDVLNASLSPKDFPPGTLFNIPGDGHPTAIANHARAALLRKYLADMIPQKVASPAAN
jgi:hypothetical protein